jgi:2-polyprenyl-3-methyl-5-hydroxy-6-metoxy-1,4-benzoquinol methylase
MMDQYEETFNTWNNIAAIYQDKFMDLQLYNDSYDFICNSLTIYKAKLLEIGCGPGNISKYLLSKKPDFDILGIDIAPNMIQLAKVNNPTATFKVMDSRQIMDLNTKYDGIICGFCLPYMSPTESNELISNSYALLNENGLIYLSFVEGEPERSDFKVSTGGRVYFYYHRLDALKTQLVNMKFDDLKTFKVKYKTSDTEFDIHTILIAKKSCKQCLSIGIK